MTVRKTQNESRKVENKNKGGRMKELNKSIDKNDHYKPVI